MLCIFLADILGFGPCIPREVAAAVDFWLAMHATAFFGNKHSTMSCELMKEIDRLGRTNAFYTQPCDAYDTCF
jgi:hypothetical protein